MAKRIRGRVWIFGDNIDTDVIIPSSYLALHNLNDMAKHAMEPLNEKFSRLIKPGDIIVAGRNFGCGSSREEAALVLKQLGIGLIIAESFARIFFRNAINLALPVLQCASIANMVKEGNKLEVNLETGEVKNITARQLYTAEKLPDFILNITESGGIIRILKARLIDRDSGNGLAGRLSTEDTCA